MPACDFCNGEACLYCEDSANFNTGSGEALTQLMLHNAARSVNNIEDEYESSWHIEPGPEQSQLETQKAALLNKASPNDESLHAHLEGSDAGVIAGIGSSRRGEHDMSAGKSSNDGQVGDGCSGPPGLGRVSRVPGERGKAGSQIDQISESSPGDA